MEKTTGPFLALPEETASPPPAQSKEQARQALPGSRKFVLGIFALVFVAYLFVPSQLPGGLHTLRLGSQRQNARLDRQCVQPDPLLPSKNDELDRAYDLLSTSAFHNASVERLSGAVRVKTESFDDLGPVGEDPRWDVFYNFHAYLKATFPLIHEKLELEKVNTHGLLYTWKGSDESLKPTLLMAHQDVVPVPVETIGSWTHPPWAGVYDGKYIWGRGSSDCKNQLIAVMETLELLLQTHFEPRRTILLSFGFDEECSGTRGAKQLAASIEERYGNDGIAVIVDEGSSFETTWGTLFAKPGTAEKGATDVDITIRMPGGHSSIPSDHTSIGVLSELIAKIESEQYRLYLDDENPYYTQLQCGTAHSPEFPSKLKKLLSHRRLSHSSCKAKPDYLAIEAAKQGLDIKYLMQTSQAVDVISGGAKANALPERVTVTVDHRINVGESTQVVWDRLTALAGDIAKKHNLTLHAFDGKEEPSSVILTGWPTRLEPAPVTPADASVDGPYAVLAGTVRALYGKDVVVTPGIMTGNTDTRYYWGLTKHIFRFGPGFDPEDGPGLGGIHTVNERISVKNHINAVKWFTLFVRNMDEATI